MKEEIIDGIKQSNTSNEIKSVDTLDDADFNVQWKRLNDRIIFLKEDEQKRAIDELKKQFIKYSLSGFNKARNLKQNFPRIVENLRIDSDNNNALLADPNLNESLADNSQMLNVEP